MAANVTAETADAVRNQIQPQPESQTTTSHVTMTHLSAGDRSPPLPPDGMAFTAGINVVAEDVSAISVIAMQRDDGIYCQI